MRDFLMRPMSVLPCSRNLTFVRAEECTLYDSEDNAYLDVFAANGNVLAGHAHPLIREAYSNPDMHSRQKLFEDLQQLLPGYLSCFQLFPSGIAALQQACRISRQHRGKPHIIAISEDIVQDSFLVMSSSDEEHFTPLFSIDTHFELISHNLNHPPVTGDKRLSQLGKSCKGACLCSLESLFSELADQTAAIIIEPSIGVGGSIEPCHNFFGRLSDFCLANGIDLIANEIQCGIGRTGSRLFGFQLLNIHPDIVCVGPSIANGYPIGVTIYADHFADLVEPVANTACSACSAASATLKLIADNDLLRRSEQLGQFLKEKLDIVFSANPLIRRISGLGLMIEIELVNPEAALATHHRASRAGLITGIGNVRPSILRLTPPLIFTADMAEEAVRILLESLISSE
ncbi:MAG: aminotransferase class III-fold pyridoxal phosphate-dependent enzyme [Candidatus Riflebacteria bacterium]|nr:aminotransferase class III-fold pyridoxal phosphate-dependent enzyme [Candidatus Riflebacteria bacterium]